MSNNYFNDYEFPLNSGEDNAILTRIDSFPSKKILYFMTSTHDLFKLSVWKSRQTNKYETKNTKKEIKNLEVGKMYHIKYSGEEDAKYSSLLDINNG